MTQDDDEFERKFAPRTLPEQVAEELGAEIVAGRRKPGERLIELELAQCFGVSRGPIREAIRILERRRLVEFNPRRGAYVRPLSLRSVADLFDVRMALSLLAVRTMATRPVESYIDTFARRCAELDAMVDDGDPIAFARVTTRADGVDDDLEGAARLSDSGHPPRSRRPDALDARCHPPARCRCRNRQPPEIAGRRPRPSTGVAVPHHGGCRRLWPVLAGRYRQLWKVRQFSGLMKLG
jgi:DNA-binding transcriptional regulator YhcF (GntR family)